MRQFFRQTTFICLWFLQQSILQPSCKAQPNPATAPPPPRLNVTVRVGKTAKWEQCVDQGGFARGDWLLDKNYSMAGPCTGAPQRRHLWRPSDPGCSSRFNYSMTPVKLCGALRAKGISRILTVGDSVQRSFSADLVSYVSTCSVKKKPIVNHGEAYFAAPHPGVKHTHDTDYDMTKCKNHRYTLDKFANADVIIINFGHHYMPKSYKQHPLGLKEWRHDMRLFLGNASAAIRSREVDMFDAGNGPMARPKLVLWRHLVYGHPECYKHREEEVLLTEEEAQRMDVIDNSIIDADGVHQTPYGWELRGLFNQEAPAIVREFFPDSSVMDVEALSRRRADLHEYNYHSNDYKKKEKSDCLHYNRMIRTENRKPNCKSPEGGDWIGIMNFHWIVYLFGIIRAS